ncbi:MAG: glutarate dioxygenase GlaH [Candidatus Velthaea sp.]
MSSTLLAPAARPQQTRFALERGGYRIAPHPHHARMYHIELQADRVRAFLAATVDIDVQQLEYVPFMRFIVAQHLETALDPEFSETIRAILRDRESGGFTIGVSGTTTVDADYVKFGTAVAHLIGAANFDSMSGTFFARFLVKDTDDSDSYLRQAYRTMTLHTDGTFVDQATDWLLMMKFAEHNAAGGESRLLHLDDWRELEKFSAHPLGSHEFTYKSPPSKRTEQIVKRRTFFQKDGRTCVCFIDQFAYPQTIAEAAYLNDFSNSIEASAATIELPLPPGNLVMLNNAFWMHGRAAFRKHPDLHRELMRQRGVFAPPG